MASSALQHWTASPKKEGCHWQAGEKIVKHDSWPIQPDIVSPPLLRLTSRKPLWLDLQLVDIKSRWRHNWKSAQVVNSHLVCDPTIRQPGFDLRRQQWSFLNRFFARCRDTAVPAEGSGDLQTPSGSRRNDTEQCLTLYNPVPWQNWMAAYLGYTVWMTLFCGWPVMVDDTHTRRRRMVPSSMNLEHVSGSNQETVCFPFHEKLFPLFTFRLWQRPTTTVSRVFFPVKNCPSWHFCLGGGLHSMSAL